MFETLGVNDERVLDTMVVPVLLMRIYFYIHLLVHELGHVFAALLMGWRVVMLWRILFKGIWIAKIVLR